MPRARTPIDAVVALACVVATGCGAAAPPPPAEPAPASPIGVPAPPPPEPDEAPELERVLRVEAGVELERLTREEGDELLPAPRPDGGFVLFQVEHVIDDGAEHVLASQGLIGIDPAKPEERFAYTPGRDHAGGAAWLPSGEGFVLVSNAHGPLALHLAAPLPSSVPPRPIGLGAPLPEPETPSVSPDGKLVALSIATPGGGRAIATFELATAKVVVLGEGRTPSYAPRGDRLAFVRTVGGFNHVFVAERGDLARATQLTSGGYDCDHPSFSPDGRFVVFASNRGHEARGLRRDEGLWIDVVPAGGGAPSRLTRGTARAATPRWSSDGWIYFATDERGHFDLARLRPRLPPATGPQPPR